MNQLIPVTVNEQQEQTVSGRELHMFLGIRTAYKDWFPRMCEHGFTEETDFNPLKKQQVRTEGEREVKREITDHIMKIDMAKELCMLARNEKGKQARKYFIDIEREWNSPEKVMARALQIAQRTLETVRVQLEEVETVNQIQSQRIAELEPMKEYVDTILASQGTLTVTQIAADYGLSAKKLNKILHEEKIQHKVNDTWILYTNQMNKGYTKSETLSFELEDGRTKTKLYTKWTQKGRLAIRSILTKRGIKANMDKAVD